MSKKIRALYLTSQFPTPTLDWFAFTVQRIKAIQRTGISVVVACSVNQTPPAAISFSIPQSLKWIQSNTNINDFAEVQDIQTYYLKQFQVPKPVFGWYSNLFLYWQILGRISRFIYESHPDIILSSWLPSAVVACKLGGHFGIPIIAIAEGSDINVLPTADRGWRYALKILNNQASSIVCVSNALKDQAVKIGLNRKRMVVIHNGVDIDLFTLGKKKPQSQYNTILTVSRLSHEKGIGVLIESFNILSRKYGESVHLIIIGEGNLKSILMKQIERLNLNHLIKIIKPMPQVELVNYYHQADVLCVPSLSESFGCVLIEAMACGVPVVATEVGGMIEIINPINGLFTSPNNPQELAEKLDDALTQKWEPELIRQSVTNKFSWDHSGDKFMKLIQELTIG